MRELMEKIKRALTPELRKPGYVGSHPLSGHCYVASEALYHLMGGQGLVPCRAKDDNGITHWWLVDKDGQIIDLTAEQYRHEGKEPPYSKGRRAGFLTRKPSKRAALVIERVNLL